MSESIASKYVIFLNMKIRQIKYVHENCKQYLTINSLQN